MHLKAHETSRATLRGWMNGRRFFDASAAMAEAEPYHPGMRKDGVTPEFAHQISIANHLRTLSLSDDDIRVLLIATFFHDTPEDKGLPVEVITTKYGERAGRVVHLMTKKFRGMIVPADTYFSELATDPLAAICKGGDRSHNLSTMLGPFSRAKQISYCDETEERHLPMMKRAARTFPAYEAPIENLRQTLKLQINLMRSIHEAQMQPVVEG